jgi:hypothetical protein
VEKGSQKLGDKALIRSEIGCLLRYDTAKKTDPRMPKNIPTSLIVKFG